MKKTIIEEFAEIVRQTEELKKMIASPYQPEIEHDCGGEQGCPALEHKEI